jgi:hypothetical protein
MNHNKIKHSDLCLKISNKECKFSCDTCNKKFRRNANLKYHKNNTCKIKNNEINKINILENELIELKNKINNISNNTLNNISNNNSNVNNGTINIYINKTGTENVLELNDSEKNEIFNKERAKLFYNFPPTIQIKSKILFELNYLVLYLLLNS